MCTREATTTQAEGHTVYRETLHRRHCFVRAFFYYYICRLRGPRSSANCMSPAKPTNHANQPEPVASYSFSPTCHRWGTPWWGITVDRHQQNTLGDFLQSYY